MPVIIGLAVRWYGWSVREALVAATVNAAYVLDWPIDHGSLEPGSRADVLVLDGPAEHIPYRFGHNPVAVVIAAGELAWVRRDQAWRVSRS
jgi:imidazolonepropionase